MLVLFPLLFSLIATATIVSLIYFAQWAIGFGHEPVAFLAFLFFTWLISFLIRLVNRGWLAENGVYANRWHWLIFRFTFFCAILPLIVASAGAYLCIFQFI